MSGFEVLGAAASIAGILSLAGQSIKAAVILHGIYQDIATASDSLRRFLRELNNVIGILNEVQDVVRELERTSTPYMLASLQIQLEDCDKDIYKWLRLAERMNPGSSTGAKETWKKFKAAVRKTFIVDAHEQMATHCRNISLSLAVPGRGLDIKNAGKLDAVGESLTRLSSSSHSLSHQSDRNSDILEYLSESSESLLSISVTNSNRLEELGDGLEQVKRILRSQSSMSSISDHDEFYGSPKYMQGARSEVLISQPPEEEIEQPPISLTSEEQNRYISTAENRLSRCAYDFIVKYQLPMPGAFSNQRIVHAYDQGWLEWAQLLKRHALKHRISSQILGDRRIDLLPDILSKSVHRNHQGGQTWRAAQQQSLPEILDDWYILQIMSSYIRVAQFLKDTAAINYLVRLYRAVMGRIQQGNEVGDGPRTDDKLDAASATNSDDSLNSCCKYGNTIDIEDVICEGFEEVFDYLSLFEKRKIAGLDLLGMRPSRIDQVNNWLLECFQERGITAFLHRSILEEYGVSYSDKQRWARQVLKFWSLDDAGTRMNITENGVSFNGRGSSCEALPGQLCYGEDVAAPISAYSDSTEKEKLSELDSLGYAEVDDHLVKLLLSFKAETRKSRFLDADRPTAFEMPVPIQLGAVLILDSMPHKEIALLVSHMER